LRGAGIVFFAYVGFDMISTGALEARNPQRDLPISLLASLLICTLLYVAMSLVMTGLASYQSLNVPNPMFVAVAAAGPALRWLTPLVGLGALVGLASAMLISLYGQTRIFYAMSADGLLPPPLSRLHRTWRTPHIGTAIVVAVAGGVAAVFPVQLLGELASIGTLVAFVMVCIGVIVLRRSAPQLERPFRTPWYPIVPWLGVLSCSLLMATLPPGTWWRLIAWTVIGVAIYFLYGVRHSKLRSS
jgi:APA family basic amino acid/polyamine antiporter